LAALRGDHARPLFTSTGRQPNGREIVMARAAGRISRHID